MTEVFNALSVMEAPLSEEDQVIYLLASLPDSFGMLVTALKAERNKEKKSENTQLIRCLKR